MIDPAVLSALDGIQRRLLWLAVRMVDAANRDRPRSDGLKVGGHQASSASMVTIMTALWFHHLRAEDRVSVKPHASPVFHAIQYLLGELDRSYLTRLRDFGGLQAYPSRTKDPDAVDFSTGSVGLGAVAPLCGAAVRRYVEAHFGGTNTGRFIATMGDGELDEGNVWEAIADSALQDLGNVLWIVDLNRQSLDRVVPGIKIARLERQFAANGWHVVTAKYGLRLQEWFQRPGGEALRQHIDAMPNERYQSCFGLEGAELRDRFLAGADTAVKLALVDVPDGELAPLLQNLGGHDLSELLRCYREADEHSDRPAIVFAYTVKGWGLPFAGHRLNHAALLSPEQIAALRTQLGLTLATEWEQFEPDSSEARLCLDIAARLRRSPPPEQQLQPDVPTEVGLSARRPLSTQEAFGRLVVGLGRQPGLAARLVTVAPDVAISTNLGGWVNKVGVFAMEETDALDEAELLQWRQHPGGQHIELGISEMNLFLLLGQLGLAQELSGQLLLPIGTVYDPFVCRGLDAFIYSVYSGSKFILAGTPSGVTLSAEGGAHQSTITPSIGLELPGVTFAEPSYATALDWLLCDGLARLADRVQGESLYLRLTTRPIDQAPFEAARRRLGDEQLRRQVIAGGYRLLDATAGREATADGRAHAPVVNLFASGAVVPEVCEAARELEFEGVAANVIDVTSLDRLYRSWRRSLQSDVRAAHVSADVFPLAEIIPPAERAAPIVTVHDASTHAMAWLGSVFGAPVVPLGVDGFGQSGSLTELYRDHDLLSGAIVNAALLALGRAVPRRCPSP